MSNIKGNVLILASYCGEDDKCSDLNPCVDCLLMCNAAKAEIIEVFGQPEFETHSFDKNRELQKDLDQYRWRDVNEELPEINQDCIGRWWANGREKCHLDFTGTWWYLDKMVGLKESNIAPTHWMPMPSFERTNKSEGE
ncbi:MAG: hypothetical protein V3U78_05445 [Thiotrichaceae bacterium]